MPTEGVIAAGVSSPGRGGRGFGNGFRGNFSARVAAL